ncbi:MAG: GNAT family N-acetyltransferase [Lactobacillaceae bacterium]|jgi:ribosomal protein S18 acetylase RimI-like enzyme|nr:GNAT family N-acetyltransferase [Lactobacillaceae bacterium]
MLSFRNKLTPQDPENIRVIAQSTGFFDEKDTELSADIAQYILEEGDDEEHEFIFAEDDDKTVAFACFGMVPDSEASYELYWLSTLNEYRGKGIGKEVIAKLLNDIKKAGGRKLFLKTCGTDKYAPTRMFYEKCGFKLEGVLKEYYDEDEDCYIYSYKFH